MPKLYISKTKRRTIRERAHDRCEYCLSSVRYATQPFSVEHILPVSRGGSSHLDNLAFACTGCNGHKYNKTTAPDPIDGQDTLLFHPRQQRWPDHFGWNEDYTLIIGLTPTGRATVEALQLNRPGVVNLRKLLVMAGKYPDSFEE